MRITHWLAGGVVALFCYTAAQAATITLDPLDSSVSPGDTFTVQLVGRDFAEATVGGGVDVLFDASVLEVLSVTFDSSAFDFTKTVNDIDNSTATGGKIDSILVSSLLTDPIGDFNIATIEFLAKAGGTSALDLGPSTFPAPWLTSAGADIDPVYADGSVTVVPVPAALWLMLSGLGVLGVIRKHG